MKLQTCPILWGWLLWHRTGNLRAATGFGWMVTVKRLKVWDANVYMQRDPFITMRTLNQSGRDHLIWDKNLYSSLRASPNRKSHAAGRHQINVSRPQSTPGE